MPYIPVIKEILVVGNTYYIHTPDAGYIPYKFIRLNERRVVNKNKHYIEEDNQTVYYTIELQELSGLGNDLDLYSHDIYNVSIEPPENFIMITNYNGHGHVDSLVPLLDKVGNAGGRRKTHRKTHRSKNRKRRSRKQ